MFSILFEGTKDFWYSQVMKKESMDTLLSTSEAVCQKDGHIELRTEEVCVERVIRLFLNDEPVGSLVASPSQLKELGAGFVISEGIARKVTDVVTEGDIVRVSAQRIEKPRDMVTGSSGGMSSGALRPGIDSKLTIERDDVFRIIAGIVSELWERTGGAHCSVLYSGNEFITKSSDVGRHNTVDKVIGYALLNDIDLSVCALGCTGRQPAGMISKAVNAGIPIVVSKAATTDEGIDLAMRSGLTLVCRVKGDRFCVYSHPERIGGILAEDLRKG